MVCENGIITTVAEKSSPSFLILGGVFTQLDVLYQSDQVSEMPGTLPPLLVQYPLCLLHPEHYFWAYALFLIPMLLCHSRDFFGLWGFLENSRKNIFVFRRIILHDIWFTTGFSISYNEYSFSELFL